MNAQAPRLLLFSGKGGVGKTTVAAATALDLAASGQRVLLVSTDPAHSTADVLGIRLGTEPTAVTDRLSAVEIDPEAAADAHVADITRRVGHSVAPELLPTVRRHLELSARSPGTVESALFDRMTDLMRACPGRFDRVVFDTAPTGHTLRLLALPALLGAWVEGLVRQRERVAGMERMLHNLAGAEGDPGADPVLSRLRERRDRFEEAGARLRTDAALWLVLVPERLAIEETARAAATLSAAGLAAAGLVVNRLLPDDADGEYLRSRREQQRAYMDEISARFPALPRIALTQLPRDVTRRSDLEQVGDQLRASAAFRG